MEIDDQSKKIISQNLSYIRKFIIPYFKMDHRKSVFIILATISSTINPIAFQKYPDLLKLDEPTFYSMMNLLSTLLPWDAFVVIKSCHVNTKIENKLYTHRTATTDDSILTIDWLDIGKSSFKLYLTYDHHEDKFYSWWPQYINERGGEGEIVTILSDKREVLDDGTVVETITDILGIDPIQTVKDAVKFLKKIEKTRLTEIKKSKINDKKEST